MPGKVQPKAIDQDRLACELRLAGECCAGRAHEVLEHCQPALIAHAQARRILERSSQLLRAGEPVDLITIGAGDHALAVFAAEVIDNAVHGSNIRAVADQIRGHERRKLVRSLATELLNGHGDEDETRVIQELYEHRALPRGARLVDVAVELGDLASRGTPAPPNLVGNGFWSAGEGLLIFGDGGTGKSRLALELAGALATGSSWLGLRGPPAPQRVGYLALEFDAFRMEQRANNVFPGGPPRGILVITRDQISGSVDLLGALLARMISLANDAQLDALIVDPLARVLGARPEVNETMQGVVDACDQFRAATKCALCLVHHSNRTTDANRGAAPLERVRGGTSLGNGFTAAVFVDRWKPKSSLRVALCAKSNYGEEFEQVYFQIPDTGPVSFDSESPADKSREKGNANRQRVLDAVTQGIETAEEIAATVGITRRAVGRHLQALEEAGLVGRQVDHASGRGTKYVDRRNAVQVPACPGGNSLFGNDEE